MTKYFFRVVYYLLAETDKFISLVGMVNAYVFGEVR